MGHRDNNTLLKQSLCNGECQNTKMEKLVCFYDFNPVLDMPNLGSSNSAANKDTDKWGYNFLTE